MSELRLPTAAADTPLLSPTQRKLVGFALSFAALVATVLLTYVTFAGLARFVGAFSSIIWPLAVAGIAALVMQPVVAIFEQRLKIRKTFAVVLLYGLFLLVVAGLVLSIVPPLVGQIIDFFAYLPTLWQNTVKWGEEHFPEWLEIAKRYADNPHVKAALDSITDQAKDLVGSIAPSLKQAGAGLFGVLGFIASLAIIPVYLFFFLLADRDPTHHLGENLGFLHEEQRDDVVFLVREFLGILVAFFRGQLLIGLIMGVLLATGFSIAGLKFGLAIGIIMGLLNIVPYLGSILGLSVVLPLSFFQQGGGWPLLGGCIGVFVAVQMVEGWFLTPRIMGKQTGLHPVVIIIAIFFWGQALGGILGMVLAVPLTAFFVTAWRLLKRKYFHANPAPTPVLTP